jgi:hypothetical protein
VSFTSLTSVETTSTSSRRFSILMRSLNIRKPPARHIDPL